MKVTVAHLQTAKARGVPVCVRGMRQWANAHSLSFDDFLRNGIDIEILEKTDALGKMIADIAREEEQCQ